MILPIYAALDRMDPAVIEAGKDLYGSGWATFWHVTWPTTFQGVLAGGVLVFLPAVGDFVSAQLLGEPNTYVGTTTQVIVELGPETRVVALEQNTHVSHASDRWEIGHPVTLAWRPEHSRVLR
jgi:ABC-type spermidine/putrescine transport system permease subunit II